MAKQSSRPRTAAGRALATAVTVALLGGCTAGTAARTDGTTGRTGLSDAGKDGGTAAPSRLTDDPARPAPGTPRTLVEGLAVPWGMAFLPGGDALVTERDSARLLRVTPAGKASEVGVVQGASPSGEGGLLGVAVSPRFGRDHHVFVYFTSASDNRIVRYRYDGGLTDPVTIVSGIPKGNIHNGGRLAFGPDGHLYASTGETGERSLAQDKNSLAGKILRMTQDGKPAPGNPFGTLVWTYGHRNVQGMAWDPQGRMYASEFGQDTWDEVNRIQKGHNYGWPEVEGFGGDGRYTDPLLTWRTSEASPSGMAYADGSLWVAALRGRRLWQVPLTGDGRVGKPVPWFEDRYGRLRAVATSPKGGLYLGTSNKDGRGDPKPGDDHILLVPLGTH
ncbi:PQQ-dependent sugar dehydrogenase [Sphaerisporangium fuscum]|uniref:PQQ-dependent sugar dehydrogenase n=1 Tax=Sphaerisporangium fuscum TaxID=2835868 RepID=UPI001BDDC4CB|nr:PQQ-dependent sugar dehydrogenase [Sphaerisporangium fuscum]